MSSNSYRNNGRNNGNRRNFSQRNSNNRDRNDQRRSPRSSRFRNKKNFNRDREKKEAGVTIRFEKGKISHEKIKHSFTVYGEDEITKVNTHEYIGSSDEELLNAIKDIWKIIDEYELLPTETSAQGIEMAPGRTRKCSTATIGIGDLPEPTGNNAQREAEWRRRERSGNKNRRVAFRMVTNVQPNCSKGI